MNELIIIIILTLVVLVYSNPNNSNTSNNTPNSNTSNFTNTYTYAGHPFKFNNNPADPTFNYVYNDNDTLIVPNALAYTNKSSYYIP